MAGVHTRHILRTLAEGARQGQDRTVVELGTPGHLGRDTARRMRAG